MNTTAVCTAQECMPKFLGRFVFSARYAQTSATQVGHSHVYASKTQSAKIAPSLMHMFEHIWTGLFQRNWLEDAFTKSLVFF